ncbi:O-acetyl-ADP-ribose deacetylase [Lentibacillus halophilus]|uniref:O-acetyl-ADP-ribose deacetylase n=1 Tax=Lentibacillus halophilus TaxID=295065 RepID=A0ABP3J1D4_9BACI
MKTNVNGRTVELLTGDITKQQTDAIVNAANGTLLGGGGVDGAIHRAAGNNLLTACKSVRQEKLNGEKLPTGEAVITDGFRLPATYVIHTVGPVWSGNHQQRDEQLLADCYWNSLQLAADHQATSVAFPSIATGVYRFPVDLAAQVALTTIARFLRNQNDHDIRYVAMVLFSEQDYDIYQASMEEIKTSTRDLE